MNCVSCGSEDFVVYSENSYMNLAVSRCKICGLYVTGTSDIELRNKAEGIYKKEYWEKGNAEVSLLSNFTDINSQGKKRQWISQYLYCKPYLGNKKELLEVGSGAGQTIYWFEELGFTVMGIEPDARNVELINKKLKIGKCIAGFVEDFNINERFDIIWISHVFEHLIRPDMFLRKYKRNLLEDGIIFIEVPNCENPHILKSSIHDNPSTFHFTKQTLMSLAKNSGYRVLQCDIFRPPTLFEGIINKIIKKYLHMKNCNVYPYYPKVIANNKEGTDIRIILKV